jgi:hypothetical protein
VVQNFLYSLVMVFFFGALHPMETTQRNAILCCCKDNDQVYSITYSSGKTTVTQTYNKLNKTMSFSGTKQSGGKVIILKNFVVVARLYDRLEFLYKR